MNSEKALHEQFCAYLKRNGFVWFHSRMDKRTSQKCGDPDFIVVQNGRVAFVEFKTPTGKMSPAQVKRFREIGFVKIARDVETAIGYIAAQFGSNEGIGPSTQPDEPSGAPTRFWLAHSNALGLMVVTKDQTGKWCGIRVATAEDKARFPRLPAGMME